ncbi:MAG: hypothetical protein K1X88_04100 [Nannocystaceae bacterium]|nr:hypothetical protein [Nannocystaceae bacterium]
MHARAPTLLLVTALGCAAAPGPAASGDGSSSSSGGTTAPGSSEGTASSTGTSGSVDTSAGPDGATEDSATAASSSSSSGGDDPGPDVDLSDPQLYEFGFTPDQADPAATLHLGSELAALDTRVTPLGTLVVYLHGAGAPSTCGSAEHGRVLAAMGFHVVQPCYVSDYGVDNCGDDIGGCRLEAFEGVDHHAFIDIGPPDCTEVRVAAMLAHLQTLHPGGDWQYFLDGTVPRWDRIVISGISHGASSSGVIGMVRSVERVVMLSGPLDTGQAWLLGTPTTAIDRFWGFTHTADDQHDGHLAAFEDLQLPGAPTDVDTVAPPYRGSHRLMSSAPTGDGHTSTQAGGSSPADPGDPSAWAFAPVWRTMYGVDTQ